MRDKLIYFGLLYGVLTAWILPFYFFEAESFGRLVLYGLAWAPLISSVYVEIDKTDADRQLYGLREREKQLHRLLECIESLEDDELKEWFHGRLYPHGSV